MNFKQIQQLIKFVSKTDVNEVTIENKDFKINIKGRSFSNEIVQPVIQQTLPSPQIQPPVIVPEPNPSVQTPSEPTVTDSDSSNLVTIKSPIIGTAYHAPEPGAKKFVEVGKKIKKGDTIMIVEAMKTMNHVPSTHDGVVKEICVEDGQPVEYGQTIIILE